MIYIITQRRGAEAQRKTSRISNRKTSASPRLCVKNSFNQTFLNVLSNPSVLLCESPESLAGEWDELAKRTSAVPFVRPGWVAAWWRSFGVGELELRTLRKDGRLVAVLPVTCRYGVLRSVTNYHTPRSGLLAEDRSAAAELAQTLFMENPRRVSITSLDPIGASMEACRQAAEKAGYRVIVRPFQRSP